jgi:UDP-N-acetylenolpyruvoylglucosamine reductase
MVTSLQENTSLAPLHTFHVQAKARYYSFIQQQKELQTYYKILL